MGGVYTRVYELKPPLDALLTAGVDGATLERKRLLEGVPDPARHWQETEAWRWMAKASDYYAHDDLTAKALTGAMYDACLTLGAAAAFQLARNALHVVDAYLTKGGTKKAVHDSYKALKQEYWDSLFVHHRLDPAERREAETRAHALKALESLTHLKSPLGQLEPCLWQVCQARGIPEEESGFADVLRARLPNPFAGV